MSERNGKGATKSRLRWKSFRSVEGHARKIEEWQIRKRGANAKVVLGIGRELVAAQAKLAHNGNGTFGKWRRERLNFSDTQARRFMAVYWTFGDCANLVQSFDLSALYLLSENGAPKKAIEECLALAKEGGTISRKRAQVIVEAVLQDQSCINFDKQDWDEEEGDEQQETDRASGRDGKPTPLDRLKRLWERVTPGERREFKQWVKQRKVRTEIDVDTGERKLVGEEVAVGVG